MSSAVADRPNILGTMPVGKLLVRFSLPAIVGMLVQATYNVVDRYFIGQLPGQEGADALAGITVGFPVMLVSMAFSMLVGVGGMASFSIFLGQGRKDKASKVLGNSFTLLVLIGVTYTIISLIFLHPMLALFGASPAVLPYAVAYMVPILIGGTVNGIGFGMNNLIRADGAPQIAMITMFIGAILNFILAPIFIFVLKLGVTGAGIATVLSQTVCSIWIVAYFVSSKAKIRLHAQSLKLDRTITLRIISVGSAAFAMQLAASVLNAILNNQLQQYGGDAAITVVGILYAVAFFFFMPIFGLNQGAGPIVGYNYGAQKFDRVRKTMRLIILAATIIVTFGFLVVQLFPKEIVGVFNKNPHILSLGEHAARLFFLAFPLIGFQIVTSGYFQSTGKPIQAMVLMLSRQVLFLIPMMLILPLFFGLNGIWYSMPLSDGLAALVTAIFYFHDLYLQKRGRSNMDVQLPPMSDKPLDAISNVDVVNNEGEVL